MVKAAVKLEATKREETGKGAARALRREGMIPGIVYGKGTEEVKITTSYREFNKEYQHGHFTSKVVELNIAGDKVNVLPRDIQLHPVTDQPLHVDFQHVNDSTRINVMVGMVFRNADKSVGIKRGGVLNVVRRDIELNCKVDSIPRYLEADIGEMTIGDSIHISDIKLPEGCEPAIVDRDFTVATIAGRMAEISIEDDEAEESDEDENDEESTEETSDEAESEEGEA